MSASVRESLTVYRSDPDRRSRRSAPPPSRRRHPGRSLALAGLLIFLAGFVLGWTLAFAGGALSQRRTADSGGVPGISAPIPPGQPVQVTVPDWVTVDLLPVNEYSRPGDSLEQVNGVVVHYVGNPGTTARQNRSYFGYLAETHETYASSHFLVGLDGEVIQCVPLDEVAYCSNKRNDDTISIECCHPDETGEFTQATTDSLKKLLGWLVEAYGLNRAAILRHYDITGKECPAYYVSHPDAWEALLDSLTFPQEPPVVTAGSLSADLPPAPSRNAAGGRGLWGNL